MSSQTKFWVENQLQIKAMMILFGSEPSPDAILAIGGDMRAALELHEEHTGELPDTADDLIWELGRVLGRDPRDVARWIVDDRA